MLAPRPLRITRLQLHRPVNQSQHARHFASWRPDSRGQPPGKDEPTLGELLSAAADIGKGIVQKVADTVKGAVGAILPGSSAASNSATSPRTAEPINPEQELKWMIRDATGGGLMGRFIGGVLGNMASSAMRGMQAQMTDAAALATRARQKLESSPTVRQHFGEPVQVFMPHSTAMNVVNVNGRASRQVELQMELHGPRGSGLAVVRSDGNNLRVGVRLPNGRLIDIDSEDSIGRGADEGGGGGGGRVIDVEWK